jgi:pSer/pThr/pTyr-binding forkhead associated (FHA) protein
MIIEMGSNQFQASFINANLTLTIIEGPAHDTIIEIPWQPKITIGRKPNNLLNFQDDQHLSNLHSTISYLENKFYIEDMGTTNGTWERLSVEGEHSELF